jgi:hypothetical protein
MYNSFFFSSTLVQENMHVARQEVCRARWIRQTGVGHKESGAVTKPNQSNSAQLSVLPQRQPCHPSPIGCGWAVDEAHGKEKGDAASGRRIGHASEIELRSFGCIS